MIAIDWSAFGIGAFAGVVAGALFFAGLALGMRRALHSVRPMPVLLASSVLRIAALLAVGWLVAQQGVTALAAFALAFLAVRFVALAIAHPAVKPGVSRCN